GASAGGAAGRAADEAGGAESQDPAVDRPPGGQAAPESEGRMKFLLPMGHTTKAISEEHLRDVQRAVIENKPLTDPQRLVVDALVSHFIKHGRVWIDEEART